jgi:putative membrane protein
MYGPKSALSKGIRFRARNVWTSAPQPNNVIGPSPRLSSLRSLMRIISRSLVRLPLMALAIAGACHRGRAPESQQTSFRRMSDGNVIAIILAANNTDLSYARLVPTRARNADVKAYARRMTTDHALLNARASDVATSNGITPQEVDVSLDFRDRSASRRDVLRDLDGPRFDSTYVANEVQYHQELLGTIDDVLLPNARRANVRELVTGLRPVVSAHLAHAEQLRATIASRK